MDSDRIKEELDLRLINLREIIFFFLNLVRTFIKLLHTIQQIPFFFFFFFFFTRNNCLGQNKFYICRLRWVSMRVP